MEELLELMNQFRSKNGFKWKMLKNSSFNDLFKSLYPELNNLDIQFKVYFLNNNLKIDDIKCKNKCCNNITRFNKNKNQLFKYCSNECSNKARGKNISKSLLDKTIQEKQKSNNKRKITNMTKYNYECQFTGLSDQIKQTNLDKYGYINPFYNKEFQEERKKKSYIILDTHKNVDEWYNFTRDDFVKKFGEEPYTKDIQNYFGYSLDSIRKKLQKLNIKYNKHSTSFAEYELAQFIEEDVSLNNRKIFSVEIDILSENKKFGIEYNGLMFHSHGISKYKMFNNSESFPNKHLEKTQLLEEKGFQLFHIFENEWKDQTKKEIWKSVINNKLGRSIKIGARKCTIKEINYNTAKDFLNNNHLQGAVNSSINIGLYYKDELVSLITLGKSRYNKNVEYELYRFCNKVNITVQGSASKLLKYFERNYNPKSIISYANRRWSKGNLYEKLEFEFKYNTSPNFYYFLPGEDILKSRMQFQKHKLQNIFKEFNSELTAEENIYLNNYRKIYDCGNKVYIKNY